jgi:hypothetical protein
VNSDVVISVAVSRESVLLVRADWSHFVYLGVFDNPIIVIALKVRPLRMLQKGRAEMELCKIANFK